MPRILAIDWDRHEVRALLVSSGPTGTSVAGAWTAALSTTDPSGLSGKQIGARLAAAISGRVTGKATTLVGVGRDHVQIKLLSLPPAPMTELPDLVRFQAEREFTTLGADAALDFIPIEGDELTPNQVLALALSPAGMTEAREVCEALELETDRIPGARLCGRRDLPVARARSLSMKSRSSSIRSPTRPTWSYRRMRRSFFCGPCGFPTPARPKAGNARWSAKFAAPSRPCANNWPTGKSAR